MASVGGETHRDVCEALNRDGPISILVGRAHTGRESATDGRASAGRGALERSTLNGFHLAFAFASWARSFATVSNSVFAAARAASSSTDDSTARRLSRLLGCHMPSGRCG